MANGETFGTKAYSSLKYTGAEVSDIGVIINCYEKPDDFPTL